MIDAQAKRQIISSVEKLKTELIELTVASVRIPSVNPTYPGEDYELVVGGETRVNEFLKPILEDLGMVTDLWEEEAGRANLVGVLKGSAAGKSLIFNGHVDVVPPGPDSDWSSTSGGPWSGKVSDGRIYGRGSCDMKGGNAAAIVALKALLLAGCKPQGDVLLEYVVGEEMMNTNAGTGATLKRGYKADAAVVVEPSGPPYRLGIIPASPGVFYMRVTIKGKAVHASMRDELVRSGGSGSEVGVSSIDKAFIIYEGLRKLEEEWGLSKSHPLFTRPGHFTLHPGVITGGPSGAFVISNESRIEYAIWHAPQDDPDQVKAEVEEQIRRFADTDPWLRKNPPKVEWLLWWPPYDLAVDAPICRALDGAYREALGEEPDYYGFAAVDDAAFLNRGGVPAVSCGPGSLVVAHAPNEFVEIDELVDAAKIYAMTIAGWCGI